MEKRTIAILIICVNLQLFLQGSQGLMSENIGRTLFRDVAKSVANLFDGILYLSEAEGLKNTACVVDPTGLTALNVGGGKPHRTFFSKNNSASLCASHCKDWQYVFSGTKNSMCTCGDRIKSPILRSIKCETKCPGDEKEICGGDDSLSLRRTGYVKATTETTMPTRQEASSEITVTRLPEANFTESHKTDVKPTSETQMPTRPETSSVIYVTRLQDSNFTESHKTVSATKASATKGTQMSAVYITVPVVIIGAGFVALTVCLILRRRRLKSEASVNRREASSCYFTHASASNMMLDDHNYQVLDREISRHKESSTQPVTEDQNEYLTPVYSNENESQMVIVPPVEAEG